MYIGFGSFLLGLFSNYPWMMIRGGEDKHTTSWKIPKLKEAYVELTNNYYLSYTLLDLWMGEFLFFLASSPLLLFPWRGKTLFDTILPDGKGEKEGAQFRTNHSNLSLGARARGKIL